MRILTVNVNTTESMTHSIAEAARAAVGADTEIIGVTPTFGAPSVEGNMESYLAATAVMDAVTRYDGEFDAVVLAGFGEHGKEGLMELLSVPVVDMTEAAAHVAMLLGSRFSVITTLDRAVPLIEDRLLSFGLDRRCAAVRSTGLGVLELEDADVAKQAITEQARLAVEEERAEAIVTEPTITYEGKGRDAVSGKNLIHIVMASNSDWVVPAGLGDERRFAVFEVNGSRRGDKAFFDALNAQLYGDDRAGLAAFLHEMLTRNIEGWAPRDSVPQTRALEEQKLRGLDIQQEWWLSLLQSGDRPYDGTDHKGDWAEREVRVLCESVHSSYRDYARAKGRQWLAPDQLGRVLKTYGVRRCQLGSGELRGKMAYVLPALGHALATFSELTGIPMKRLQGD